MAKPPHHSFGPVFGSLRTQLTIGIRREDPTRIWERRAPLTPDTVNYLVSKKNVRVHIESCDRRVFPNREYIKAGAKLENNLQEAHVILGIKETPLNELINSPAQTPVTSESRASLCARTHLMFSHTAKGQPYNTPLLSRFVAHGKQPRLTDPLLPRLIDYELLTDDTTGKRTVGFGWFAGVAGVLESLSAMAHSHLEIGVASPFLYTPRPHTVPSLESLRAALRTIGTRISNEGTPEKLGPFVVGLTGRGNVAEGCLSMLSELPTENVFVEDLDALVKDNGTDLRKIYLVHAKPEDYLSRLDGRKYDREHYYKHPQSYRSNFCDKVAPYLTLFLNGTGWSPSFPRLMTNDQLTVALDRALTIGGARFTNIGDISCDVEGGLQFLTRSTTLSSPFYKTRPSTLPTYLPAVQMMAVDILPTSIPLDASKHFSQALLPYLESLIQSYTNDASNVHASALDRATIAVDGKLVGKHVWLNDAVDSWRKNIANDVPKASSGELKDEGEVVIGTSVPLRKKKVLMLGSGMVAGPAVEEIAKRGDVQLVIASNSLIEVEKLTGEHLNVQYRVIDMNDRKSVSHLIADADVVISLLPIALHPAAAELCIQHHKHLVTASYISNAMKALHDQAIAADVILLNEIGLDPGIDHCSAISLISKLQAQNKRIVSFTSFCGGLPAPDVPIVPLRYKFSWSPRAVLSAALNPARYRLNNEEWNITSANLLRSYFPDIPITNDFALEGIANRDSLPYADTYNIGSAQLMRTLLRGTLRYPGFSNLMQSFKSLGLLEATKTIYLERWSSLVQQSLALQLGYQLDRMTATSAIKSLIPHSQAEPLHEALEWLSLIPPTTVGGPPTPMPTLPAEEMSPIDIFAYLLAFKLRYQPNERDMVILSHEVIAKGQAPAAPEEVYTSSLITYGTSTASAMARTVGLPVAFAALNILDGKVAIRGVTGPSDPSVYGPVLQELEEVGLGMTESLSFSNTMETKLIPGLSRQVVDRA